MGLSLIIRSLSQYLRFTLCFCTVERSSAEVKYCFTCFHWFVEEEWDRHCQTHLESIISKRCASITYCNTLFRPAFCPFCLGDNRIPARSRWISWTREAKLWQHLKAHLEMSRWPSGCPHPLCSLRIEDETSFLYHLSDAHDLKMTPGISKSWHCRHTTTPPLRHSNTVSLKRKSLDKDEQELRPSKQRMLPVSDDQSAELRGQHQPNPQLSAVENVHDNIGFLNIILE